MPFLNIVHDPTSLKQLKPSFKQLQRSGPEILDTAVCEATVFTNTGNRDPPNISILLWFIIYFLIFYINLRIVHCTVLLKYHSSWQTSHLELNKKTCCVTVGFVNLSILTLGWLKLLEYIRRKLFGEPLPRKASQRLSIEDFGHYIQYMLIHVIRDSFNFRP